MTELQLFAFIILPVLIIVGGGIITLLELRARRMAHPSEPDLFEIALPSSRPRTMATREGLGPVTKSSR